MKLTDILVIVSLLVVFKIHYSFAHPSYGIVVTDNGDIIFCDVLHNEGTLWKFSSKDGLTALLTGEHCHFIFLDLHGYIWGTDHEYISNIEGNRNTLWKIKPGKTKEIVIPPTEDPQMFSGVNFVINGSSTIFYDYRGRVYKRKPNTDPVLHVSNRFGRIISLQMDHNDNLYVVDNNSNLGSIFMISPGGQICTVADELLEEQPENPPFENALHNMLYALFIDDQNRVYVANAGSRRITMVDTNYQKHHIYKSDSPWYPVAYTSKAGTAYVMEMGFIDGVGNVGPRIISLENRTPREVINVDKDKLDQIGK